MIARGRWIDHNWVKVGERVEKLRAALATENLKPGDRVVILLPNGIDWVCLDLPRRDWG
jgi:long-chain acyl-CoA synthetase